MEESKKSKKTIIIVMVVVLVLLAVGICGYFVYQNKQDNQPTGTEWGDKYYEAIKDSLKDSTLEYAKKKDAEATISFIQTDDSETPKTVIQYEIEENFDYSPSPVTMYNNIVFYMQDNDVKQVYWGSSIKTTMEYLYNINEDKYMWYAKMDNSDASAFYEYMPLTRYMEYQRNTYGNLTEEERSKVYDEYYKDYVIKIYKEDTNNKATEVYNFDDVFIMIENDIAKYGNKTLLSMPLKQINELIAKTISEKYKATEEIVTDEVKQTVADKKQEIITKKEEAQKQQEIEKQKQVEEEKAKKEAEEAAKFLKVGNHTLKYGTYKGNGKMFNSGDSYSLTFVLNSDGTCTYKGTIGGATVDHKGTYKVTKDTWYGIEVTGEEGAFDAIEAKWSDGDGELFAVGEGNTISAMEINLKYVGN